MPDDSELLLRYVSERSDEAFAELVRRHINLVYGAAMRQTGGDVHLAQDVTQEVFAELARQAAKLARHPLLSGWLHRCTRFKAIDAARARSRRDRLAEKVQRLETADQPGEERAEWEKLGPVLDEALGELGDRDRHAILLRFFEARSFAEIGLRLKLSENAARMRVERALDKLRGRLVRRGLTSTSAALAVALADQATVAAPAGLAATVANSVATGVVAGGAALHGFLGFMITTKNALLGTALLAALAGSLYEGSVVRRQNQRLAELERTTTAQAEALRRERAEREREAATPPPAAPAPTPGESKVGTYSAKLDKLIDRLAQSPDQEIPEMRLLDADDWIASLLHQPLDTDDDYRKALGTLRGLAKQHFGKMLQGALAQYRKEHPGEMPGDVTQLASYFDSPPDPAMLQRYEVLTTPGRSGGPRIRDRLASIVDDKYDSVIGVGADGGVGWASYGGGETGIAFAYATDAADQAFRQAHNGAKPANPEDLTPYFSDPANGQKYEEMLAKYRAKQR